MEHAEVLTALRRVVAEAEKESQRIRDAGGDALKANRLGPTLKAIEYARRIEAFGSQSARVGSEIVENTPQAHRAAQAVDRDAVKK